MKYREIEFKYRADDIDMSAFAEFCEDRRPVKNLHASGYDHFYARIDEPGSFCRHRVGPDSNQLTFKRKTDTANNYVRTEHNIDLSAGVDRSQVEALCSEFGYRYAASIFKNCFIYNYEWYTLVYYICYDKDMRELGRFVEIEISESYAWESEKAAWNELLTLERLCKGLGLSKDLRVSTSLFEMFAEGKKDGAVPSVSVPNSVVTSGCSEGGFCRS